MTIPAIGATVTFHLLTAHYCEALNCKCKCDVHAPATVVEVLEADGSEVALVLDVQFPIEMIAGTVEIDDRYGEPMTTTVLHGGYIGRQSYATRAKASPPESGSWTEI